MGSHKPEKRKKTKKTREIGLGRCYANVFFMLGIAFRHTPGFVLNYCLFQMYSAAEVFVEFTIAMKVLLDLITRGASYGEALRFLGLVLFLVMVKLIWGAWMDHYTAPRAREKLRMKLRMELYEKAVTLELERYDNPAYYNEFVWSVNEAGTRMDQILSDLGSLLAQITRILASGIFFLALDRLGILFVVVSLLVMMASYSISGRLGFARDQELKPIERKRSYFNRVFYLGDYAKELRLNPLADRLREEFDATNSQVYPVIKKYGWKQLWVSFAGEYLSNDILVNTAYLGYLVYRTVVKKALSYGSAMALFQASSSLKYALMNLAMLFPRFEQHGLYVEKIRTFLAFESTMESGQEKITSGDFKSLSLEGVSFAYGEDADTLHDITMSVKAGEKIAIVGYNGAGKSTLIKLMLRLYDVKAGSVKVNGRDIREYDLGSYRSLFASVFQDYKIFASTVADNVRMEAGEGTDSPGGRRSPASDSAAEDGEGAIRQALLESGFGERLDTLPLGVDTQLTREFDPEGVNLSGGEAQKVAIARVFYKYCPVIILDEPSSALDPVSEYNLNHAMLRAAEHKAVIFISHRLSSTVMADRIYMLEKGRIIESGSHRELMELDGKYAAMFRMQAEKYQRGRVNTTGF